MKTDPDMQRRDLLLQLTALSSAVPALMAPGSARAAATAASEAASAARRPRIAMLVYPRMVALDLIGPQTVLSVGHCDIHLVWKNRDPCATDVGVPTVATKTFAERPRDLDVLFVPGGIVGTTACMRDAEVLDFLADRGASARFVTACAPALWCWPLPVC